MEFPLETKYSLIKLQILFQLRELFSSYWVVAGNEVEIFRRFTRVFRVEEPNIIRFIFGEDTSDFESKNIFVSFKRR
jgi:hypothetical protein